MIMIINKASALLAMLLLTKQTNAAVSLDRLQQENIGTSDAAVEKLESSKSPGGGGRFPNGYPVPNQKTVMCPGTAQQDLYADFDKFGQQTRFILKNTASEPVVVSYVERNGTEYSAANYGISPANLDPKASLAPGMVKVFAVQEGHVFHVRDSVTGELLMQHRAGLQPIVNKFNQELDCSSGESVDASSQDSYRTMRKFPGWQPAQLETYSQEVEMDLGFRNQIFSSTGQRCPVNFYFVKKQQKQNRKPNYVEKFSFHLGANNALQGDQIWDAATKHESTFLGHEFVVRLASNDNVVVDHVALAPEKVTDCSNRKRNAVKNAAHTTAVVIPVGRTESADIGLGDTNQTDVERFINLQNSTDIGRSFYFKILTE